jgi:CyaY protein
MGATPARQDAPLCPPNFRNPMLTDTEFITAADRTLAAIGEALDRALAASDADLDWNLVDGILEIECEDQSKLIVNRHTPNREIWLAARAGGSHFAARGGAWRDTRTGEELGSALAARLTEQSGLAVTFPPLVAP